MPNPHFRVETYSRAGGRSVVAAAAYRSGEVLTASPSVVGLAAYRSGEYLGDKATGETFDYTRKEGVKWAHIFTPADAPAWASDRQELWNRAELAENRKDARLARGIEASLPRGLGQEEWRGMVEQLADHFTRHGLAVDAAIHNVKARDGGDNPHVHLLITDRSLTKEGFHASKTNVRFLNSRQALQDWRTAWEGITNEALQRAGLPERLSLQSYATRGIDQEPTKPLGPKASELEKQGIHTPRGDENRRIMAENALREERRRLAAAEGATDARLASQNEAQRRRERAPLWAGFGARVGAEANAARDAVHRFRQKEKDSMSDGRIKNFFRQIREVSHEKQQQSTNTPSKAPASIKNTRTVSAVEDSLNAHARGAAIRAGAQSLSAGVGMGHTPRPSAMAQDESRQQGPALGVNNARRATPSAHPTAGAYAFATNGNQVSTPEQQTAQAAAASISAADKTAVNDIASKLQQKHGSIEPGRATPQSAQGQDNNIFNEYGGRLHDHSIGKLNERAQQKEGLER